MLIRFRSPHAAEFLMFGEVALGLIRSMGASGDIPGAIMASDIPVALVGIQKLLMAAQADAVSNAADDETEPPVSLARRALPLIKMLEAAVAGDSYVMWEL